MEAQALNAHTAIDLRELRVGDVVVDHHDDADIGAEVPRPSELAAVVEAVGGGLDDDDALDVWLLAHAADYVHAASSCSTVIDTAGDGGVVGHDRAYVCDASAFPDIPDANTHLPTMMLAERLTMQWVGMTGSDHA